eukprot:s135_g32.t1
MNWQSFIQQTAELRHLTRETRSFVSPIRVTVGPKDWDGGHIDHWRPVEQSPPFDTLPKDLRLDTGATESSPGSSVCSYSSSEAGDGGNPVPNEKPCTAGNPEPSAVPLPRWVEDTPLAPLEIGSPFLFPDSLQSSPLEATQLAAPKSFDFSRLKVQAERIASSK